MHLSRLRSGLALSSFLLLTLGIAPSSWAQGALQLNPTDQPFPSPPHTALQLGDADIKAHGSPLSDGLRAKAAKGDIVEAWLSQPTERYGHGVLGDAIEAGAVTARRADGTLVSFVLPNDSVFEDLSPRLGDLDGDGKNEIVVVRSYLTRGGAIAVLGLDGKELKVLAEAPAIGRANRWLNPSILADLDGSGALTIGLVRTPHIGGQLQLWRYKNKTLTLVNKANGFSNHSIGSRALGLSTVLTKGKARRILLPDATQSNLLLLDGTTLKQLARLPLPARPTHDFVTTRDKTGHQSVLIKLADHKSYNLTDPTAELFD